MQLKSRPYCSFRFRCFVWVNIHVTVQNGQITLLHIIHRSMNGIVALLTSSNIKSLSKESISYWIVMKLVIYTLNLFAESDGAWIIRRWLLKGHCRFTVSRHSAENQEKNSVTGLSWQSSAHKPEAMLLGEKKKQFQDCSGCVYSSLWQCCCIFLWGISEETAPSSSCLKRE